MKSIIFLAATTFFIINISCKKEKFSRELNGTWRLVEVYDKSQSATLTPPAENGNDLSLTFKSGKFSGHTLNNTITDGKYNHPSEGKILFGTYSMTQVNEDVWGSTLTTVLNACALSSSAPCQTSDYSIVGDELQIDTPLRYRLKFVKL